MSGTDDAVATMRRAIRVVRREWYKAAFVTAVLDGTVVGLAAMLVLAVGRVDVVPVVYASLAAGLIGAAASFAYRLRRAPVERFEAVNPGVAEALRTARDVVEDGDTTTMARALYADVIDRLQTTSSIGLLHLPRLVGRFVVVFALSVAVIQASMLGVDVGAGLPGGGADGDGGGPPSGPPTTPTGLQPGDDVLGDPEPITPGGENLSAVIGQQPGPGEDEQQREYETGGLGADGSIEAERAGYAPPDDLENAELIKEYNLRIREVTDDRE